MDEENGFHCQCPEGFKPPYCYSQVDECGSSPCVHGSCRDSINGYATFLNVFYLLYEILMTDGKQSSIILKKNCLQLLCILTTVSSLNKV